MLDILLVDDETAIRLPVGEALRAKGHRVSIASDGDEAMARLDAEVFQLVLSDVRLPRGDGFSILRRVRRDCPWTDVLLMTAYGTIADAVTAMKEQAIDYVTKPFDVQELVTVVARIDERRQLRAAPARSWWPGCSTTAARGGTSPSSPSTARPCRPP
jgi:DNA-binding NtrC family response regulator